MGVRETKEQHEEKKKKNGKMGQNEKSENVLKRAHGDEVTPEKKRKVDDEVTAKVETPPKEGLLPTPSIVLSPTSGLCIDKTPRRESTRKARKQKDHQRDETVKAKVKTLTFDSDEGDSSSE